MTTTAKPTGTPGARDASSGGQLPPQFRYGAVFLILLALLVFEVLAPDADWARAFSLALAGAALTVAVATSRERRQVRRRRARWVAGFALAAVVATVAGLLSTAVIWLVGISVIAAIPVALGGGLLRLIRDQGVTPQAVAGALAVYLTVGLLFATIIALVSRLESGPYFVSGGSGTNGDRVYYSLTVLTTTGFGDYTARTPLGHALAVLEMLVGQLYLVTVIGVLVGNFAGRRAASRGS